METHNLDSKAIVKDLLGRLPDLVSLREIAQEIEFIAAVRQGQNGLDGGDASRSNRSNRNSPRGLSGSVFVASQ